MIDIDDEVIVTICHEVFVFIYNKTIIVFIVQSLYLYFNFPEIVTIHEIVTNSLFTILSKSAFRGKILLS